MTTIQQCVSQYRNINFSTKKSFGTEKYFLKNLYRNFFFLLRFIFLYWDTHCCTVVIFFFAFFKFFFAATFIFVLRFIFLYWDKYCCTVVYMNFTVLKNIVAQPINMFVLELMFLY